MTRLDAMRAILQQPDPDDLPCRSSVWRFKDADRRVTNITRLAQEEAEDIFPALSLFHPWVTSRERGYR